MKSGIWILTCSKQLITLLPARDSNLNYIEILSSKHVFGAKRSLLRLHFSHGSPETNQTEIWHPRSVSWKYKIQIYVLSVPKALAYRSVSIKAFITLCKAENSEVMTFHLLPGTAVQPVLIPACTITSLSKVITFWASCQDMHEGLKQEYLFLLQKYGLTELIISFYFG